MGGRGSGRRYRYDAAGCTDDYRQLDVRRWRRDGFLTSGRAFSWSWQRNGETVASIQVRVASDHVTLNYRSQSNGGDWQPMEYPIYLEWTGCTYGGRRVWFLCPAKGCKRRVAILYGGATFVCRHCRQLAYACQRERASDRAMRQADKIRERLNWQPGILNEPGNKPKGMHWRTFERLTTKHDDLTHESLAGTMRRLSITFEI